VYLLCFFGTLTFPVSAYYIELPQGELGEKLDEAWVYYHNNDFKDAIEALKKLMKEYPEDALVEHTLGFFYFEDDDFDNAVKYFQDSLVHSTNEKVTLWNHLHLADIFRQQGFIKKSEGHLDFVEKHDLSPNMITNTARIRQDLRIVKILDSTFKTGNITVRYPHYLLPADKVGSMAEQIHSDWERVARFLNLSGDETFEVFVFPSAYLFNRFFPLGVSSKISGFEYRGINTVYIKDGDYLDSLAPYGYHLLMNKFNRYGTYPWMVEGLDDAIRESYKGIPLNSWVSELYSQDKLPNLLFLLDPDYLSRMDPDLRNPTAGSFILFMKSKFHPNDYLYILTQPNLEFNFKLTIQEIEAEWIRYAKSGRSLLENSEQVTQLVERVPVFDEPPVVGMDLVQELRHAATLDKSGNRDSALLKIEDILAREPRYGEALYLKGKIYYDENKFTDAQKVFMEAIKYLPPNSVSFGWTAYFLGRIAKLTENFEQAQYFYSIAAQTPLPPQTLVEVRTLLFNLDKYFYLKPQTDSEFNQLEAQSVREFLLLMDDFLRVRDWNAVHGLTAYELNSQTLANYVNWFRDPVRFQDNVVYSHTLEFSEVTLNTVKCEVTVRVEYPGMPAEEENTVEEEKIVSEDDGTSDNPEPEIKIKRRTREFKRFMLLTKYPDGWRVLDYFDVIDLYK
jgi:tetratricopeptide (TPR) repeat protein